MSAANILRLVVLFFAALVTGALMVNWIGLARAMARLSSASAYTEFHQASIETFDPYMPIVVIGALLGGIAPVVLPRGSSLLPASSQSRVSSATPQLCNQPQPPM
jgi:hypothetical protein